MSSDPDVRRSLGYIRDVTRRLRDELAGLPPEAWDGPTNCPPWSVRQLVAHVISSGEGFRLSVERGVAGLPEPPRPEERERRMDELSAATAEERIEALDRVTDAIEDLYGRLDARQLEAICYHRRGNRSAHWYVRHRLGEVAFHTWDLQHSLDRDARFDEEIATFLLPTLIESNLPRIYPSGPGGVGRFRLTVEGEPAASWLLTASPERLDVARGDGAADVTITASPAALALLVYGRAGLADLERDGRVRVEGDRALAARFHAIFATP
jgi:uncharacterized protein (TIGR03083 family)